MEILTDPEQIRQHIRDIYKPNHFMMDYFHINIEEIHCGSATVSLKTDPEKQQVYERYLRCYAVKDDTECLVQTEHMDEAEREAFLQRLLIPLQA